MKRKLWSLITALALCMGLAVPALALDMTTDEGLAPLSLTITDQYGAIDAREVACDYVLGMTSAYNSYVSMDTLNGYFPVTPDCRIDVANLGGSQDCHIRVLVYEHEAMTRAELLASCDLAPELYPEDQEMVDYICGYLPQDSSIAYVWDEAGKFMTADGGWDVYYNSGFDNIKRIQEGESTSFTLPNAEEGTLYRVQMEVCYPTDEYPTDEECYYYYRYFYLKVDSAEASAQSKPTTASGFSDVADDAWYAKQVKWAVDNGITSGTGGYTFSPDRTCSTAEILTFLWRAAGSVEPTIANPFTDVTEADYFYKPAVWAYENGLVSGTTLNGGELCTRAATVTYLWKLAGAPAAQAPAFVDVSADADYAQAVQWAVENGVTGGISSTEFGPAITYTRGQIVTFLYADFAQ